MSLSPLVLNPVSAKGCAAAVPGPPLDPDTAERTARMLGVLGDPTRLLILSLAAGGECLDAAELAARLGESLPSVMAHVDALVAAGCLDICHIDQVPSYCVTVVAIARLVRR